ncbi:RDD family protein [Uliginosibacterium sp. 31-12]|uniref:RDD family protein n=1 Tax=Uliginosibacterium sp. 31-12 TaxID=3062781 RepID=UPI0026E466D8|nr:RDD family protein [Uliginosibacterium sp. 31-12]MDO6388459.1 RDD family protein [Uliginosibacterium sp. 31-12]
MKDNYFTGGRRASAIFIDTVIISLLIAMLQSSGFIQSTHTIFGLAIQYFLLLCYFALSFATIRGSAGKLFMKLRVLDHPSMARPSNLKFILRTALASIAYLSFMQYPLSVVSKMFGIQDIDPSFSAALVRDFAFYWLIANLLFITFSKKSRAVYDWFSKTTVVEILRAG